jgi:hypothetical protein
MDGEVDARPQLQGYVFDDETTMTDDGRYRARAVLVTMGTGRTRTQRFIDLETFAKEDDARKRSHRRCTVVDR